MDETENACTKSLGGGLIDWLGAAALRLVGYFCRCVFHIWEIGMVFFKAYRITPTYVLT
jgi:hypothetical protein